MFNFGDMSESIAKVQGFFQETIALLNRVSTNQDSTRDMVSELLSRFDSRENLEQIHGGKLFIAVKKFVDYYDNKGPENASMDDYVSDMREIIAEIDSDIDNVLTIESAREKQFGKSTASL